MGQAEEERKVPARTKLAPPPRGQQYQEAPRPGIPVGEERLRELKRLPGDKASGEVVRPDR